MPAAAATALPSSTRSWTRWPRSPGASSAAKCGSCGRPVSAATELTVALKISFDHCAGRRSANTSAPGPRAERLADLLDLLERRVLVRPHPRRRVEDVLDLGVRVLRARHERHGRHERPVPVGADDLRAEAVERRHQRRVREPPLERAGRRLEAGRLRRDDPEVERLELVGVGGGGDARLDVAAARHAEPVAVERVGVLLAAREHRDLRDLREMPGVEAPITPAPITQTRSITSLDAYATAAGSAARTRGITAEAKSPGS